MRESRSRPPIIAGRGSTRRRRRRPPPLPDPPRCWRRRVSAAASARSRRRRSAPSPPPSPGTVGRARSRGWSRCSGCRPFSCCTFSSRVLSGRGCRTLPSARDLSVRLLPPSPFPERLPGPSPLALARFSRSHRRPFSNFRASARPRAAMTSWTSRTEFSVGKSPIGPPPDSVTHNGIYNGGRPQWRARRASGLAALRAPPRSARPGASERDRSARARARARGGRGGRARRMARQRRTGRRGQRRRGEGQGEGVGGEGGGDAERRAVSRRPSARRRARVGKGDCDYWFPILPNGGKRAPCGRGRKNGLPGKRRPFARSPLSPPAPPPLARDKSAAKNRRGKWRRRHCAPHRRARHLGRPGPRRIDGQAGPFDPPRPPGTFVIETTPIAGLIGNPLVPGRGQRFSGNVSFTLYACTIIRWRQGG